MIPKQETDLIEKLMYLTGEDQEHVILLLAIGAARAEELANESGDLITEIRAHRIINEINIILRKKGIEIYE